MPWHELSGRGLGVRTITVQGFGRPSVGIVRASLPFFFHLPARLDAGKMNRSIFFYLVIMLRSQSYSYISSSAAGIARLPESYPWEATVPSCTYYHSSYSQRRRVVPAFRSVVAGLFPCAPFFDLHLAVGTRSSGTATGSAWRSLVLRRVASRTAPGRCAPILTIRMIRYIAQNHFFSRKKVRGIRLPP